MADKIKYDAAIKNGVSYYIINATDTKHLFQTAKNVLNFIDFSKISELECKKFANYKSIKDECELWNRGYNFRRDTGKITRTDTVYTGKITSWL